jgi:hypothetical protein
MLRGKDTYCCILLGKRQELLDPVRKDLAGILVSCEEGGQKFLYPVRKHGIGIPFIMCGKRTGTPVSYAEGRDRNPIVSFVEHCKLYGIVPWAGQLCVLWSLLLSVNLCHVEHCALEPFCCGALRQWIIVPCAVERFAQCNFVPCGAFLPEKTFCCGAIRQGIIVLCEAVFCHVEHCVI